MQNKPSLAVQIAAPLLFLAFIGAAIYGIRSINYGPAEVGVPRPLRSVLAFNDSLTVDLFNPRRRVRTFKTRRAKPARVNGNYGMTGSADTTGFVFYQTTEFKTDTVGIYSFASVKRMNHHNLVYNFKCIEGWSQITWWGGARLSEWIRAHHLGSKTGEPIITGKEKHAYKYIGLVSIDGGYFVGIDMPSAMHPQTLLCYELSGKPLSKKQGAPLRLIIPVKYGVKSIKQIGSFFFSDTPPPDFWYNKGYDYNLGH